MLCRTSAHRSSTARIGSTGPWSDFAAATGRRCRDLSSSSSGHLRFLLSMIGDPNQAEEITQEVFVWLIHHPEKFDPKRGDQVRVFLVAAGDQEETGRSPSPDGGDRDAKAAHGGRSASRSFARDEMLTISNFTGHPSLTLRAGFVEVSQARSDWGARPEPTAAEVRSTSPCAATDNTGREALRQGHPRPCRYGSLNVADERPPRF